MIPQNQMFLLKLLAKIADSPNETLNLIHFAFQRFKDSVNDLPADVQLNQYEIALLQLIKETDQ